MFKRFTKWLAEVAQRAARKRLDKWVKEGK